MTIQEEIINYKDGALLVKASPGSGKTTVLTKRIKSLLSNKEAKFHVLALTFTNKAADELKDRLDDVRDIDKRAFVGTFHSFCLDIIQRHGYAIGLKEQPHIFEKNEDRTNLLIQVFEKPENWDLRKHYEKKNTREQQLFIINALAYISKKKKQLKGIEKFDFLDNDKEKDLIQKMYREYNDLLVLQNAMDFDDVLIKAYQIFTERESIAKSYRKQYKYIFIDEAQDLNFAQYELLKVICNGEHKNVMMVGDIKQSLYHFNDSDIAYMETHFVNDFCAEVKFLDTNYRSSKAIIEVANKIFSEGMKGYDTQILGKFKIFDTCESETEEAKVVVEEIKKYLISKCYEEGDYRMPLSSKDIAILARNRYLLKHVEAELVKQNILHHFKKGSEDLSFDSQLMKVFDLGLRILINPIDILHFSQILIIYGIEKNNYIPTNAGGLDKLKFIYQHLEGNSKNEYSILIESWVILHEQSKFNLRDAIEPIKRVYVNDAKYKLKEPKMTYENQKDECLAIQFDLEELENYYSIYSRSTDSSLKSLSHFKTQLSLGLIIPKTEEGIVLSTIHLTKGLEFPIVFMIGLDDDSLPYFKSKIAGGKALAEEKNIFYVGVTRAKRVLYLSYPKTRIMPWNPSYPKPMKVSEYLNGLKELEN